MTGRHYLLLLSTLTTLAAGALSGASSAKRPNIILIMGDDMGYSDLGCYGSEIQTPALDKLAANGLRYTQFYNTSRCCPTRASLLTGLYAHQAGIGHMMNDRGGPSFAGDLNNRCVTIAEVLKTAGYSTYMVGKWHVTPLLPTRENPSKHNWPLQRGFDKFFGTIHGAGSFYDPNSLTSGNEFIVPPDGFYYTDAISDTTVDHIRNHTGENPYFIYVSYTAAHWPLHALPEDIKKYEGRYSRGWDALRKERYQRMIDMGLIDRRWKLSDRYPSIPWEEAENKPFHERCMEVYAAQIDNMDQGIGRIVEALKEKDQFDHTLIFFLQDNGGVEEAYGLNRTYQAPEGGEQLKPMGENELQTQMVPAYTRDGRPVKVGFGIMPGPEDTYIGYARNWGNASNTPFRMFKHWSHEGGISSPLIVHWPNGIAAKGEYRRHLTHLIDIMATCVDVAEASYPKRYNGVKIHPLEGVSLTPSFHDKTLDRDTLYWEHEGNRAIRMGRMKLVSRAYRHPLELDVIPHLSPGQWRLYDMQTDRSETNDLAPEYPGLVYRLADQWTAWAERVGALPRPERISRHPLTR